jgi:CelD/BcsL family acetyltransferase involved in cellulose biosynthesis
VRLTELTKIEELRTLENEWRELWIKAGKTPFQSPMWLIPWAENFTSDNLLVLAIHQDSRLAALAPFYVWGPDRTLFLLGNGLSDYLDIIVDERCAQEIRPILETWLKNRFLELNQLPHSSFLRGTDEHPGVPCPVLRLSGKSKENYAPPRQLEKLRYYRRRAERIGRVHLEVASVETCEKTMETLFQLHSLRWSARGESGVLHGPELQRFHREVARNFANSGHLRLHTLRLDETVIGVLYAFAHAEATYFYVSGFDPALEKISPGTLLIGHAIERALEEAHVEFNFLRGGESYKYSWGAKNEPTFRRITSLGRTP